MSRAEGGDEPHRGEGNPPRDDPIREPARRGGERDVEVGGERERRGALGVAVVGVPDPQLSEGEIFAKGATQSAFES